MATRKKTARKKAPAKKSGPKAYSPTTEERQVVSAMIAAGISTDIARRLITNPKTNRPFARSNFWKLFKNEIELGGKSVTGKAVSTLVRAMDDVNAIGNMTSGAVRAAEFWLKTRESELFSERRINENIEKKAANELGKLTDEDRIRIARNVLIAAEQNEEARKDRKEPSIHDAPAGTA